MRELVLDTETTGLEHELGHALGLGHVEVEGHIMHPMYMQIGRNFWIP